MPLKEERHKRGIKWCLGILLLVPTLIISTTCMAHIGCAGRNECQERLLEFVVLYVVGVLFLCCYGVVMYHVVKEHWREMEEIEGACVYIYESEV